MTGLILRIVLLPYVPVFSRWQTPDNRYRWPASGQGADIPVCFNLAGHNKYRAVFSFAVPDQNQGQSRLPIAVKFNLDQTGAAVVVIFLNLSSSWRSAKVTTFFPGYLLATLCCKSFGRSHASFDGPAAATWTNTNRQHPIAEIARGLSRTAHVASASIIKLRCLALHIEGRKMTLSATCSGADARLTAH